MPELPEVETVAKGLRQYVVGKTIKQVIVHERKKFKGTSAELKKFVLGKNITSVQRRAKWLVLQLSSTYSFIIHLKMTGQLLYDDKFLGGHTMVKDDVNHHTRVEFVFTSGDKLYFNDMRKFGYVELHSTDSLTDYFTKKNLGIEPIDKAFTLEYWLTQLKRHGSTSIKAILLNQSIVAGIGNIYADDACWLAKVKPMRRVNSLTLNERKALWQAAKRVIAEGIKLGGTSFSHYYRVDGTLGQYWSKRKVYGRTGEPCKRDKTLIKKTRCAGRGTHYCPKCQK